MRNCSSDIKKINVRGNPRGNLENMATPGTQDTARSQTDHQKKKKTTQEIVDHMFTDLVNKTLLQSFIRTTLCIFVVAIQNF